MPIEAFRVRRDCHIRDGLSWVNRQRNASETLALLALRETALMGMLLAVHLGCVAGFFATLAWGKFAHAPFRAAALLRAAMERGLPR